MKVRNIHKIISRWVMHNERLNIFLAKHWLWLHLHLFYYNWKNRWPDFSNPEDLDQWLLALSYKNSKDPTMRRLIPLCADKAAVRDYVAQKGYEHTLVKSYGAYSHVQDIPFDQLPSCFMMKMNNTSGRNRKCANIEEFRGGGVFDMFDEWLKDRESGLLSGEWQYSLIEPKIVIEQYMESLGETSLIDYKFQCIQGKPYSCVVAYDRNPLDPHGDVCFDDYDLDWSRTDNIYDWWHKNRRLLPKPKCWEQMKEMATTLCQDFEYVRVDMYEVDGRIIFGELTFTPQGCIQEFYKDDYLKKAISEIK